MAGHFLDDWINIASEERNAIVFEERNKAYGAFPLRKEYPRTLLLALLCTLLGITLIALTPKIIELVKGIKKDDDTKVVDTVVQLTPPPPADPTEPPPPPPPPPPPVETTVRFVPPVVVNKVVDDEPPPVQTDETPKVSTVTNEGSGNKDDIAVPEEKAAGPVAAVEEIFTVVEEAPDFAGGSFNKYCVEHINYPQMELSAGIQGTVYITFVVEKDGSITDVKQFKGVAGGPGLTQEAIRVIKTMPKWKPGKMGGHPVRVQYTVPVKFRLSN